MKTSNISKIFLAYFSVALFGCASQFKYGDADYAKLQFVGNTKNFYVNAYENRKCETSKYGERVATFSGPIANVKDHISGIEVNIPAGKEFIFTANYIDAKPALNRTCKLTAGFKPELGEKYIAYFSVNDDVTQCNYAIRRLLNNDKYIEELTAFVPKNLCSEGKDMGPINGQAGRIHWGVKIVDEYGNEKFRIE